MATRGGGTRSLLLAAGILGATVMPHAIYLHSALVCERFGLDGPARSDTERSRRQVLLGSSRLDIGVALGVAATVNLSLIVIAAAGFPGTGVDSIEGAYTAIGAVVGTGSAVLSAVALLASGLASSSVGAYAGAVVLEGFAGRRIPPLVRRLLTVIPFGVPFALWPLVVLTRDAAVMGGFANRRLTTVLAAAAATAVSALNVALLVVLALSPPGAHLTQVLDQHSAN